MPYMDAMGYIKIFVFIRFISSTCTVYVYYINIVCMSVFVYGWLTFCMYVCMFVQLYVCVYVCIFVCTCMHGCISYDIYIYYTCVHV